MSVDLVSRRKGNIYECEEAWGGWDPFNRVLEGGPSLVPWWTEPAAG